MIYTIKKGRHFASWLLLRWPFFFGDVMSRKVIFTKSCRYKIGPEDQHDWNKLFGFTLGWKPLLHSVRFGWRYRPDFDMIEIGYYLHVNGAKRYRSIIYCTVGELVKLKISTKEVKTTDEPFSLTEVFFQLDQYKTSVILYVPYKKYGFKLFPYFGGNQAAPHTIQISITKP
ncbi:MAG: hypothetical protein ACXWDO_06700 [Bacteroidia bacterium]